MVNAATAPIKQAQATTDQASQANQHNVTGLSSALAGILQGIAPQVQQDYGDAATRQAAFAKGFSDHLQQTLGQNATNTSSFLQNIVGAPSSQVSQVASQVAPSAAGDTLYGVRGYIPASTLNEEGAAYTANARQLPAIANSQGLQQIGKIQADQAKQDAAFAQQIGTEAGKAPQYQRQLTNDAFNQNAKTHAANLADAKFGLDQSKFTLQQNVDAFNQKYKVDTLNLRGQSLQLQSQKFARSILQSDRSYSVSLAGLGLRTAAAKRSALAQEYKLQNGGYDVKTIGKLEGDATRIATQTLNGFTDTTGKKHPPILFGQALAEMRMGGKNGQVPLSLALKAMKQAGWNVPAKYDKLMAGGLGQSAVPFGSAGVVGAASSFLGVPYKWGGNNPATGLDCSSFIQQTFAKVGVSLPRTTYAQVKVGKPVALDALQPGDCIFTRPGKNGPEHVGLYVGNGMVQESPHTGDVNKVIPLKDYLSDGFVAARRYGNG